MFRPGLLRVDAFGAAALSARLALRIVESTAQVSVSAQVQRSRGQLLHRRQVVRSRDCIPGR